MTVVSTTRMGIDTARVTRGITRGTTSSEQLKRARSVEPMAFGDLNLSARNGAAASGFIPIINDI